MIFYQILYTKLPIYGKKRFLKKITLPSQNLRYLDSGKSVFRLITKGRDTNQIAKSDLKKISNLSQFEPTWTTLGTDLTTLLTTVNCIFSGGPEEFKGDKSQNIGLDTATFTFTVTSNPKPRSLGVFSKGMLSEIVFLTKCSLFYRSFYHADLGAKFFSAIKCKSVLS